LDRAVDVDAARFGVFVLLLLAIEPDDARDDRVAARGFARKDFACRTAVPDDRPAWQRLADLVADAQFTEGRLVAAVGIARTEFRSGNLVIVESHSFPQKDQLLLRNADHDLRGATRGAFHLGSRGRERQNGKG